MLTFTCSVLLAACTAPRAAPSASPGGAPLQPSGPAPEWPSAPSFVVEEADGLALYGVGSETLEGRFASECVVPQLFVERAANRGRAALAKLLERQAAPVTATSTAARADGVAIATLQGSEVIRGWFDGERTIWALVRVHQRGRFPGDVPDGVRTLDPTRGVPPNALLDAVRAANRAALEASGACADPYARGQLPCCGAIEAFCADPARFDHRPTPETCACGEGAPCLEDYRCEVRGGAPRCLCRGVKCGCGDLTCRTGQTCGDERCY